jgi:hypothetical protein
VSCRILFWADFLVEMYLASALFLASIHGSRTCLLLSNQSSRSFSSVSVRFSVILTSCLANSGYGRFSCARPVSRISNSSLRLPPF